MKCKDCAVIYVGESGRQIRDRFREHKNDIVKKKQMSNVYAHVRDFGHSFDFDNAVVLDSCPDGRLRRQLESVHTYLQQNPINRAINFNSIYHPALQHYKD